MINAGSVCGVLLVTALGLAQDKPAEKNLKPGEFDPYNEVVKDINTNSFAKAITDLDIWAQKFPDSEYKDDRAAFYVQAYAGANQPAKALEAGAGLLTRDLGTVFPGAAGPPTVIRLLYSLVWAIAHDPNPTPEALAAGDKAAHLLMAYDQPIPGVTPADWQKARVGMKEQADAALLAIAMQPGIQAMAKQPPDCVAADAAYARVLGAFPDKYVVSYELGRAMRCESKDQPAKLSAAIYEFERAAVMDPTLGDPKGDSKKVPAFADSAYVTVHGSDEGLEQLKQAVRQSPLPPEGFKIKTATEIAEEKRVEFEKSNPQLAMWMQIKGLLADTAGEQYFTEHMKDAAMPQLRGVLIAATPACRPRELTVGVPLPDAQQSLHAEIRLKLDKPLAGKPELNQEFQWEGVGTAFTKDPFLLTMDTESTKIDGLKTSPCASTTAVKKK